MAKISLDLNSFKSAGVYTIEIDQSERIVVSSQSLRLVPGFSENGVQNTPVFITSASDLYKFYGTKNTQLERKGSYFHRTIETCLQTSPVFAISLLNVDTRNNSSNNDKVGYSCWAVSADNSSADINVNAVSETYYYSLYNRSRFWSPSAENLQKITTVNNDVEKSSIIQVANVGTKDFSVLITKAEGLKKFDVLVSDWYGNVSNIPYSWMKPYNYISDYFINVVVLEGKHDVKDRATMNSLLNNGSVNVIGNWVGTIIPDFRDGNNVNFFIEDIINANTSLHNVLFNINKDALEFNEKIVVDFLGESLIGKTGEANVNFLGYKFDIPSIETHRTEFDVIETNVSQKVIYGDNSFIYVIPKATKNSVIDNKVDLSIGDFVIGDSDTLVRITNKLYLANIDGTANGSSGWVFTTSSLAKVVANKITKQINITSDLINDKFHFRYLKGLTIQKYHKPGYNADSTPSVEGGISKIYGMLMDEGILRGLLNPDMISYRYIVDSMGYGLQSQMGGKHFLSLLAKKRGKCTAIISAPSMSQFANAQDPYFCDEFTNNDPTPVFNTKWIAEGGNPNMVRSFRFSLPSEDNGAKYCGVFGPYLKYNDNGKTVLVPPAADVSNAYLRKFLGGNPYAIVANRNGLLSNPNIIGVEYMIDKTDRDYLEPFGYNSIIERPKTGEIMIYSNATSFQNVNSDFNYLHVRELLNTIEIEVESILLQYVFEHNNEVNRLSALNSITPILQAMQDSGALYKFEVQMDSDNNTDAIVDEGFAIVDIGVWITKGMEKIIQRISVNKLDSTSSGGSVNV